MVMKLGDKVVFGGVRGYIAQIDRTRELPLLVKFDAGLSYRFTLDGRVSHRHTEALLKHVDQRELIYENFTK